MYIGVCQLTVVVPTSTSLKDKRMVVRRIKDRVREKVGVTVNEVGSQDDRQRAELGCSVTSSDRQTALELIDHVVRVAQSASNGQVIAIARDAITYEPEAFETPVIDDRTGSGDKAAAQDDWIPDEWKTDSED